MSLQSRFWVILVIIFCAFGLPAGFLAAAGWGLSIPNNFFLWLNFLLDLHSILCQFCRNFDFVKISFILSWSEWIHNMAFFLLMLKSGKIWKQNKKLIIDDFYKVYQNIEFFIHLIWKWNKGSIRLSLTDSLRVAGHNFQKKAASL